MVHTTLKIQVVIALFRHGNDQLSPFCRDGLRKGILSQHMCYNKTLLTPGLYHSRSSVGLCSRCLNEMKR